MYIIMDKRNSPKKPLQWGALIESWLQARHLSKHAETSYRREVERFVAWWLAERDKRATPDRNDFMAFLEWLELQPRGRGRSEQRLKASSLAQARRIVGGFLRWLASEEQVDATLAVAVSGPTLISEARPIPDDQLRKVLQIVDAGPADDPAEQRAQLAAHLAFWAGASRSEMALLRFQDIRRGDEVSVRLKDSMGEDRWIEVPQSVYELACTLAGKRKPSGRRHLFTTLDSDGELSAWSIAHGLNRLAGPELGATLTPRFLRDCFTQIALQAGWSEGAIALHLRRRRLRKVPVTAAGSFLEMHRYIKRLGRGDARAGLM